MSIVGYFLLGFMPMFIAFAVIGYKIMFSDAGSQRVVERHQRLVEQARRAREEG